MNLNVKKLQAGVQVSERQQIFSEEAYRIVRKLHDSVTMIIENQEAAMQSESTTIQLYQTSMAAWVKDLKVRLGSDAESSDVEAEDPKQRERPVRPVKN